jgi:hypothetical protein
MEDHVKSLIEKASKSERSDEAMKFAQAALNAANAMCALKASRDEGFPEGSAARIKP